MREVMRELIINPQIATVAGEAIGEILSGGLTKKTADKVQDVKETEEMQKVVDYLSEAGSRAAIRDVLNPPTSRILRDTGPDEDALRMLRIQPELMSLFVDLYGPDAIPSDMRKFYKAPTNPFSLRGN